MNYTTHAGRPNEKANVWWGTDAEVTTIAAFKERLKKRFDQEWQFPTKFSKREIEYFKRIIDQTP